MIGWLRDTEEKTGHRFLADDLMSLDPDLRMQEIAEGFSYVARNNAVGKIQDSALPAPIKAFFRAFREHIASALRIAKDFASLRQDGKIDPEFSYWLDMAAGLETNYQKNGIDPGYDRPSSLIDGTPPLDHDGTETFAIPPLGPGARKILEAPEVVPLSNLFDADSKRPADLRREFGARFDEISREWPAIIHTPEGPIAWSKSKTGRKLRTFKDGEPALLHFIAAARLPDLLANSRIAFAEPEAKGDRNVQEVHRRYAWADFPNGERRHVLLTVERASEHADESRQETDHAYASEVLGVSLEVLPQGSEPGGPVAKKDANVVNLKTGGNLGSPGSQAVTLARGNLARFLSGIKPEHRGPLEDSQGINENSYDSDDTPRKPAKQKYIDRAVVIARKILKEGVNRGDSLNAPDITPMPEDHQMVQSRVEIILVHSRKGDLLGGEVGGTGNIVFDGDYPVDAITTHNHPSGKPPSATDLFTTLKNPGWTTRVVSLNEKGNLEIWEIKAKGDFEFKDRQRLRDFYYDEKGKYGDTALARRRALELTLKRFGQMIEIHNSEFTHEKSILNGLTPEDLVEIERMENDPDTIEYLRKSQRVIDGIATPEEEAWFEEKGKWAKEYEESGLIYGDEGDPVHSPGFKMRKPEEPA